MVISAKVGGQPTPMVHWWVLRSSILPADTEELLPQSKVTSGSHSLKHPDSFFLSTQVEGQSPGEDSGTAGRAADGRRHP